MEEVIITASNKTRCDMQYNGADSACKKAVRKNPDATCRKCPFEECELISHRYESELLE